MSFKCNYCAEPQKAGTAPTRRVVLTRPNKNTHGTQIVREMDLCTTCLPVIDAKLERHEEEMAALEKKNRQDSLRSPLTASLGSMMR